MFRVVLLMGVAVSVLGQDKFFEKYTYSKTMSQCFGNRAYEKYLLRIASAERECNTVSSYASYTTQTPYYTTRRGSFQYITSAPIEVRAPAVRVPSHRPFPTDGGSISYPNYGSRNPYQNVFNPKRIDFLSPVSRSKSRFNQNQLYDSVAITEAIDTISNALRNFTCVLHRLELIDQYLNINYDMMINNYFSSRIDGQLRTDLVDGINYCKQLTSCLPEESSPIPYQLQLVMAFIKCEKKTRLAACFKNDLRRNIDQYDVSALPNDGQRTTELEKLMAILIGSESLDQLDMY